jgi:hypothetical protein
MNIHGRLRVGECVFICWEDSCCFSGWKNADELEALDYTGCVSVGWVIRKTDRVVTLTPNANAAGGISLRHTNGHILIPISAIKSVERLALPNRCKESLAAMP